MILRGRLLVSAMALAMAGGTRAGRGGALGPRLCGRRL